MEPLPTSQHSTHILMLDAAVLDAAVLDAAVPDAADRYSTETSWISNVSVSPANG